MTAAPGCLASAPSTVAESPCRPWPLRVRLRYDVSCSHSFLELGFDVALQTAIYHLSDPALRTREQKAGYLHFTDPALAQQQLCAAVRENAMALCPVIGVDVRKARPAAVHARTAAEYLVATYDDSTSLVLGRPPDRSIAVYPHCSPASARWSVDDAAARRTCAA